ncbi:hypothetical protein [Candidatus Thiosymbion oneisti]|uniref:hypothetical protein n=1 Tax=Candidatus Thiosymbion oneisti TaxID=589554 RepID=UPI000B7F5805|nr:hypothetical protein [Candidatus Thiosymbion oneisti]
MPLSDRPLHARAQRFTARSQFTAYYHHLIDTRGLKKIQAVCAVMRKLLLAIQAMLKNRRPFDSSRFYSPAETVP